jgi:hypothetical protein
MIYKFTALPKLSKLFFSNKFTFGGKKKNKDDELDEF